MILLCYNRQRSERTKSEMREWRNRQTRTFEGRVVIPYGFKSRLSHQKKRHPKGCRSFFGAVLFAYASSISFESDIATQ